MSEQIARDLSKHLDERITTFLHDYMDRCATAGVSYEDATQLALSVLSHHAACAAHGINLVEREFMNVCKYKFGEIVNCVIERA